MTAKDEQEPKSGLALYQALTTDFYRNDSFFFPRHIMLYLLTHIVLIVHFHEAFQQLQPSHTVAPEKV
jgi:hypothetical protein